MEKRFDLSFNSLPITPDCLEPSIPTSTSAISWWLFLALLIKVYRCLSDPSPERPWNLLAPKMSLWRELRKAILKAHCLLSPAHFSSSQLRAYGPPLPQPALLSHQTLTGWLLSVLQSHSKCHSLKKPLPPHPNTLSLIWFLFFIANILVPCF